MINKQIKNLCININKSILDALNKFDKNRNNFLIVVNSKNQFKGIITISDIRRTIIKGNSIESSIKKFINPNPVFYKDNGKKKMLQEFLLKAKIKNIEPIFISEGMVLKKYISAGNKVKSNIELINSLIFST